MTAAKRRPGALPGTINNPTGKNQFDGDKGKTNTEAMIEAVNLWIANKKSAKNLETQ